MTFQETRSRRVAMGTAAHAPHANGAPRYIWKAEQREALPTFSPAKWEEWGEKLGGFTLICLLIAHGHH